MSMLWIASGVDAQQQINPAVGFLKQRNLPSATGQVREGEITFKREDSKKKDVDEGGPGHTNRVIDIHTINASATVRFCGCGRFYISDVSRNWSEKWERGYIDVYDETLCPNKDADEKSKPVPVSPGNEDSNMERGSAKLYTVKDDKEKEALKNAYKTKPDGVLVRMVTIPYQGKYRLDAFVEVFTDKTANAESLKTEVCSQKRKHSRIYKKTVPLTQKPQKSKTGGEDDTLIHSESHPIPELFGFSEDILLPEGQETIKGKKTLVDKKEQRPGDWNRKTVVTWKLRMKNYCNDVFNALYENLAVAEAKARLATLKANRTR